MYNKTSEITYEVGDIISIKTNRDVDSGLDIDIKTNSKSKLENLKVLAAYSKDGDKVISRSTSREYLSDSLIRILANRLIKQSVKTYADSLADHLVALLANKGNLSKNSVVDSLAAYDYNYVLDNIVSNNDILILGNDSSKLYSSLLCSWESIISRKLESNLGKDGDNLTRFPDTSESVESIIAEYENILKDTYKYSEEEVQAIELGGGNVATASIVVANLVKEIDRLEKLPESQEPSDDTDSDYTEDTDNIDDETEVSIFSKEAIENNCRKISSNLMRYYGYSNIKIEKLLSNLDASSETYYLDQYHLLKSEYDRVSSDFKLRIGAEIEKLTRKLKSEGYTENDIKELLSDSESILDSYYILNKELVD